jgi:hypothetical protein
VATAEQLVPARSLMQITDDLVQCFELLDAAADEDKPLLEQEIQRIISVELATKVDGIAWFQKRCDAEVALIQDVIKEIETRIGSWNKRKQRVRDMVKGAMNHIGASMLKGKVHSISLGKGAESLEITDEYEIPKDMRLQSITMTVAQWDEIAAMLPSDCILFNAQVARSEIRPDSKAVRAALKAGTVVPGAQLKRGEDILTIR